jgi:hypothetical protein
MGSVSDERFAAYDRIIDLYMRDVDRTLLRRNLALTAQQRLEQLQSLARFAEELRQAGAASRSSA